MTKKFNLSLYIVCTFVFLFMTHPYETYLLCLLVNSRYDIQVKENFILAHTEWMDKKKQLHLNKSMWLLYLTPTWLNNIYPQLKTVFNMKQWMQDETNNCTITIKCGPYYSSFSQLLRQTNWLTFSESRADRFLWTMWPATENSLSHGTVDAGVARYLRASRASLSWHPEWAAHHCKGQSSMLILGSALYLCMSLSGCTSSSDSESEPICRRFIFFLGGSAWDIWGDILFCSCSMPASLVHTSSLSLLGRLFKSLKRGSSAVASLSHALLVFSWREARSSLNVVLNFITYAGSSSLISITWCKWQRAGSTTEQET